MIATQKLTFRQAKRLLHYIGWSVGEDAFPDKQVTSPGVPLTATNLLEAYRVVTARGLEVWCNTYDDWTTLTEDDVQVYAAAGFDGFDALDALDARLCGVTVEHLHAFIHWQIEENLRCTATDEDGKRCSGQGDWDEVANFEYGVSTLCERHQAERQAREESGAVGPVALSAAR